MSRIPELDIPGLRRFAFIMAAMLAGLFGLFLPWLLDFSLPVWPWVLALLFVLWGSLAPASIRPIYRLWMQFGLLMNRITTPVILGILFFVILTPTGLIMRTLRPGSMTLRMGRSEGSYRVKSQDRNSDDMEKPF